MRYLTLAIRAGTVLLLIGSVWACSEAVVAQQHGIAVRQAFIALACLFYLHKYGWGD